MIRLARILALAAVVIVGCVTPDPAPRFTPAWEKVDTTGPGWVRTRRALLCADCQFNNLYSKPLPERNLSAESMAATAIRPPQLDLYSPDVLRWILRNDGADADVILHLGDAANVATTGEFDRFLEVMKSSGKPWFMAPGNHDFFYYGIYAPESERLLGSAAYRSGVSLLKGQFIRTYVAAILGHDDEGCAALAAALGIERRTGVPLSEVGDRLPLSFEWEAAGDGMGLLHRICWRIDEEVPWRSYILQGIDLGGPEAGPLKTKVYLLDSCQYSRRPEMVPNAWRCYPIGMNCGLTGQMLPDQLLKLREWLEDRDDREGASLMCHHPFENLEPRTRTNLGHLWREYHVGVLVTAHTHQGYFAHHNLDCEEDRIELNIGSTTDWPMEWRTLQAFANEEERLIYIHAGRNTLVDVLEERGGFFLPGWEIPPDDEDDYRKYKQGESATGLLATYYLGHHFMPYWLSAPHVEPGRAAVSTETQIKDTLLWTYARLIRTFPTDPASEPSWPRGCVSDTDVLEKLQRVVADGVDFEEKVEWLVQLEAFERSRRTHDRSTGESTDHLRERYKISQAAWASRFMKEKGRRLRVEDEKIRVNWDRTIGR
ncbi:MAG: metallophosphoesterase [Planctomycetota bacterium]